MFWWSFVLFCNKIKPTETSAIGQRAAFGLPRLRVRIPRLRHRRGMRSKVPEAKRREIPRLRHRRRMRTEVELCFKQSEIPINIGRESRVSDIILFLSSQFNGQNTPLLRERWKFDSSWGYKKYSLLFLNLRIFQS